MKKRAAIYVRVSTQEQKKHGYSVDAQLEALRKFCFDNDYIIAGEYNDAGISARKKYKKRPALLKLIEDCQNDKIDIILFTKLDRWFRSVADYYEVQGILDGLPRKIPWRAIWEDYETETSAGVFKVNIMLSVSQSEADRTSDRMHEAIAYRKANGDFIGGRVPIGYKRENKKLVFDEKTYDAVNSIFQTYLASFSIARATEAAARYGIHVATSHICRMLKSEAYCGNASGSICPAYISIEEHDKIMKFSTKRNRTPKRSDRVYLFSGLCSCGYCGSRLIARVNSYTVKGETKYYAFYSCQKHNDKRRIDCPGVNLSEKKIEAYLLSHLDEALSQYSQTFDFEMQKTEYKKDIINLEQRLRRIGDRYEFGDINFSEYKEKRIAINTEISKLKAKIDSAPSLPIIPENWKDIYAELSADGKKSFWLSTIGEIVIDKEHIAILFDT